LTAPIVRGNVGIVTCLVLGPTLLDSFHIRDRGDFAQRPVNNRAKVTNGTRLLDGVDGRSAEARRYRDLVSSFAADLGGDPTKLSELEKALIRQAAATLGVSEKMQAAIVRGEVVDLEQATRVANTASRCLARLAAMRKLSWQHPASVADILARRKPEGGPE
jgi:hypothetical protein